VPSGPDWWPSEPAELQRIQLRIGAETPGPTPVPADPTIGGCFVCFERGRPGRGAAGDRAWAGAAAWRSGRERAAVLVESAAGGPYVPGLLAIREGRPLAEAVAALVPQPDVLLANATGRDHPRRAGLALHLGASLGVPSVGVTHRPLLADGPRPADRAGAVSLLTIGSEPVGAWVRTRAGARPLAVSPGWGITVEIAVEIVMTAATVARTPEPIRLARRAARTARSRADRCR
jgi:deoxyribonuclease V